MQDAATTMDNQIIENKQHGDGERRVCKTFTRRFDSDPRLQQPSLIFNDIRNSEPRYTAMLGYAVISFGDTGTGPGPDTIAGGAA